MARPTRTGTRGQLAAEALKVVQDLCTGMTQLEVAELTGIDQPSIGRYLRGTSLPTFETFETILNAFDRDVELVVRRSSH